MKPCGVVCRQAASKNLCCVIDTAKELCGFWRTRLSYSQLCQHASAVSGSGSIESSAGVSPAVMRAPCPRFCGAYPGLYHYPVFMATVTSRCPDCRLSCHCRN